MSVSAIRSEAEGSGQRESVEPVAAAPAAGMGPVDLDRLIALHQPQVTRMARRLLGFTGEVEDAVQDVFVIAIEQLPRFRGDSSLETWLTGITIRVCRRRQRNWRRAWRAMAGLLQRRVASRTAAADPEDAAERDETGRRVRQAVAALPTRDREVIVLYYLEQVSVKEIAASLGVKPGTVEVRLHRARKRLAQRLDESAAS